MIIIDTDHLSELQRQSIAGLRLRNRLNHSHDQGIATTIITAEEQLRGRLAVIKRLKSGSEEVPGYQSLSDLLAFFEGWTILPFDRPAALVFGGLATPMVQRVGPMDCKIAAIALSHRATLLSANLSDFRQVPGLIVEDWLRDDGPSSK